MKRNRRTFITPAAGLLAVLMSIHAVRAEEEIQGAEESAAEEHTEPVPEAVPAEPAAENPSEEPGNEEAVQEEELPAQPAEPTVTEPAPAETQEPAATVQASVNTDEPVIVSREITTEEPAEEELPEALYDAEEAEKQEEIPAEDAEPEEPPVMMAMRSAPVANTSDTEEVLTKSGDTAQDTATVTIGSTTFDTSEDVSSGWNSSTGTGWKNVAGEYIAMVGFDGSGTSLTYEGKELTIMAAGTNRIRKIVGEGNLNLTGTGILLIDEIQLSEGGSFNLHTNTAIYDSGSVAVFLKDKGSQNVYTMLNGTVSGLIDEYTVIPEGVTLVVPSGNTLELEVVAAGIKETETEDGQTVQETVYSTEDVSIEDYFTGFIGLPEVSTGRLVIPAGSTVRIDEGAKIYMHEVSVGRTPWKTAVYAYGTLEVNGRVQNGVVEAKSGSTLTGSGRIGGAEVNVDEIQSIKESITINRSLTIRGGTSTGTINLINCQVKMYTDQAQIGKLNVAGNVYLGIADNNTIGTVSIADGGSFTFCKIDSVDNRETFPTLTIKNGLYGQESGGTFNIWSGTVVLDTGSEVDNCTIPINHDFLLDNRSDYALTTQYDAPVITSAAQAEPYTETDTVPVVYFQRDFSRQWITGYITTKLYSEAQTVEYLPRKTDGSYIEYSESDIIYKDAENKEFKDYIENTYGNCVQVEVYKVGKDGSVQLIVVPAGSRITLEDAFLIRVIEDKKGSSSGGGSSSVDSDSSFTGSGTLGGNSAGVVTSSNSGSPIFTGTGITEEKEEDKPANNTTHSTVSTNNTTGSAVVPAEETVAETTAPPQKPAAVPAGLAVYVTPAGRRTAGEKAKPDGYKTIPADRYTLAVYSGNTLLSSLGGRSVAAEFFYTAKTDKVHVFFRGADGALHEMPAVYDTNTGTMKVTSTQTGPFMVVQEKMPGKAAHPAEKYTIH